MLILSMQMTGPDKDLNYFYPEVPPNLDSNGMIRLMNQWYYGCLNSHQQCPRRSLGGTEDELRLPTRLIDIGPAGSKEFCLRTTDSERLESISDEYVTLSHRWDSSPFLQLNDLTKRDLEVGMPITNLPATFRDAVFVAHHLGVRYLWIDSLCIRQDCLDDWLKEAPRMQHIYGGAAVNIVAGHSDGPESGLFHARDSHLIESFTVRAEWDDEPVKDYVVWNETEFESDYTSAPLTQRGWVFQERLLAPRILQFGKMQVYWRCSELFACESWPFGASSSSQQGYTVRYGPDLDDLESSSDTDNIAKTVQSQTWKWERLIMQYSACDLTRPEDKLIALSGIAKLFRHVTGDRYLAGLWQSALPRLLCWYRRANSRREAQEATRARPVNYRAPSWSWASIDDAVSYDSREDIEPDYVVLPIRLFVQSGEFGDTTILDGLVLRRQDGTGVYLRVGILSDTYSDDDEDCMPLGNDILGSDGYISFRGAEGCTYELRRHPGEYATISII